MANRSTKVFATGKIYWAKIVGERALVPNYDQDGREWTFEFEPDDPSFLKEHRLLDRLKDPMAYALRLREKGEDEKAEVAASHAEGRKDYLLIRKPELTKDGAANEPFRIYDEDNKPWGEERLIGNGSTVDVKLDIRDWGVGKKKSIYAAAIRVTDLVPYESDEFAGMDNAKPAKKVTKAKAPTKAKEDAFDDLDDELPPFE